MEPSSEENKTIREYLLGTLSDKAKMQQIEERLMMNDDFAEQLSIAEDNLIEEYLDDELNESERNQFVRHFLIPPERKEELRLTRGLRKYAAENKIQTVKELPKKKVGFFDWKTLFSSTPLRYAVAILLIFGIGFGVWRIAIYQSDVDKGLAELRLVYHGERPVEVRIAGLDYAPLNETRGADEINPESARARESAETYLRHAVAENATAGALQALGKFYLTEKNFDKANKQFERAAALAPDNAELQSDWGATLFEMGKKAALEQNGAKNLEYFDQSLKHLDKSIALNPQLPEPKFNRALCLQALFTPELAKQAWREYLELDANSPWADEARRNLQNLEAQHNTQERSANELERDFLAAFQEKNNKEAWQLLSGNRELIREKYLPQRLAMSFLEAAGSEKEKLLQALQYTGELEKRHTGDPFASEIANFYKVLPEKKLELLKQAQNVIRQGYELCLKLEYKSALNEFETAHNLFLQAGDIWEAELSEYFIGYCLVNTDQIAKSQTKLSQIAEFSHDRKYKWLEVTALYWLASSYVKLQQHTQAKAYYEKAVTVAEEIKDSYAVQRNLLELAIDSSFVGQKQLSLNYLNRVLETSNSSETSLRQKYRNYENALQILITSKFYSAAKAIALEAVGVADKLADSMFETVSRNDAGFACVQTGSFAEARSWLNEGREKAETIIDELSRKRMIAYSFLESGYLERQVGDYEKSENFYDQAVKLYETMQMPFYLYAAQKGKLLNYQSLGKSTELEQQIPLTLKLTEDYRDKILEEQERTSFFATEESIYDIAVAHKFDNGEYEESYNYTEISNSRSLLDWLQKGTKISTDRKKVEVLLEENAIPKKLSEIRAQMPDNVQLLQYSVLDDRVLIWLISKEKFTVVSTKIQSGELSEKVENYVKLLQQNDPVAQQEAKQLGAELYKFLITPIHDQIDPTREICLIPNKVLFYLPFAALLSSSGNPLLAEFNLFYSPSANIFLVCTENARNKALVINETLLSVGNPTFDHQEFKNLSDLPTAEREVREISTFYARSQTLLGREANKIAFENLMKDADVIHFAGHYVVVHDAPLSSYLVLAQNGKNSEDSILTNSELIGEKLPQAKLVVLSACQTGVEQYYNGEGLIGLSRTFLAAGTPLVVASQWSVDTTATAELMKRFHFYRQQGKMTTSAALRSAQLEMLKNPDGRFKEPYYWAAFAAFGGYTTF